MDICLGLIFLKENDLFHFDLKPGNILYDGINFILSDFGTCNFYYKQ